MALTTLDPVTALIIVDLQNGLAGSAFIHPIDDIVTRTCALMTAFRRRSLPIVLVNVDGTAPGRTERPRHGGQFPDGWTDFLPQLERQPGDIVVTKRTWGPFASTDLETRLKGRGVTQVVITGVATGTGVESTARQAYEAGLQRHARRRRHDGRAAERARLQHRQRVPAARRDRLDAGHHRSPRKDPRA